MAAAVVIALSPAYNRLVLHCPVAISVVATLRVRSPYLVERSVLRLPMLRHI
jgi:hypothetical protein